MAYKWHYMPLFAFAVAATGCVDDAVAKPKHRVHRATPAASTDAPVAPLAAMSIFCDYSLWS
ncbi:MAG: hypothetical protein WAU74_27550, partial [Pseudolabrys sp.]